MKIQPNADHQEAIKEYAALMKLEKYFEAHEVLEAKWLKIAKNDPERDFYKGLIQAAAGKYQIRRHELKGGFRLLKSAVRYLEAYEFDALGLNLSRLCRDLSEKTKP